MRPIHLVTVLLFASVFLTTPAFARPWQGVEPGKNTHADVKKKFGEPHRELKKHGRCAILLNYQSDKAIRGTKQTNFCFDAKGILIEIAVFPDRTLSKSLVGEAYGTKYQKKLTDDFREYHLYKGQGMAIFFDKDGQTVHSILFTAADK